MKALSIRQPWVWAITHAGKRIENRTWSCSYRGTLLLHASMWWSENQVVETLKDINRAMGHERWKTLQDKIASGQLPLVSLAMMKKTLGHLIAKAEIVDCIPPNSAVSGDHTIWYTGEYGLVLDKVELLPKPIPFSGSLGLFDVPDRLLVS